MESRKGQDLVLLAFREFSNRHPNAVLVTAWHSPWERIGAGYKGKLDAPLELDENGATNIKKWAVDNGIDPRQVIEIFTIPNQMMPTILREMDVALQPSRAEACTNLPGQGGDGLRGACHRRKQHGDEGPDHRGQLRRAAGPETGHGHPGDRHDRLG